MICHRSNSSLLQPFLLKSLILLVVINYFSCVSAFPQTAEEPLQKTLELRQLRFTYVEEQPDYMRIGFRATVPEDATWYDNFQSTAGFERPRDDPDTIVAGLIDRFDDIYQRTTSPQQVNPPYRFAFHLPDPPPNYISDERSPGRPFVEDYMWQLDPEFADGAEYRRMLVNHWRPYYETFYMDGPFRMQVFYIAPDYTLYSGLIEVPAEAISPYPGGVKVGEMGTPMQVQLDFVRDLDDELEIED